MAITKAKKTEKVQLLAKELETSTTAIVGTFAKLTVAQDFELRKTIRQAGGKYRVVKNNLIEKASEGTPAADLVKGLRGMTSMAYTAGDPVALAKALSTYAKTNPSFTFKAGMVEGRVVDIKTIQEIASMPSREGLLAKLLFLIQAPGQRLVTAINAVGRDLAVVIDQGIKESKFSDESEVR